MQQKQIERVDSTSVYCQGLSSLYDHPKIYFKINAELGSTSCPYCSKKFHLNRKKFHLNRQDDISIDTLESKLDL